MGFGPNFFTQQCIALSVTSDGGATCLHSGRVHFLKSCCFLKGTIQKGVMAGISGCSQIIVDILGGTGCMSVDSEKPEVSTAVPSSSNDIAAEPKEDSVAPSRSY